MNTERASGNQLTLYSGPSEEATEESLPRAIAAARFPLFLDIFLTNWMEIDKLGEIAFR
jgi:hypothetical protein